MTTLDIAPPRTRVRSDGLATPQVVAGLYFALVALAASPVLLWPIPRGVDLVNHWARLTLYHQAAGDPIAGLYRIHFGLIPNLGIDLLYLALSPLMTPLAVIKLAWALSIALPALGAFAIHRALYKKPSPTIWLVPFFSYNVVTTMGLLNFALGAGLAILAVAYALRRPQGLRASDVIALNAMGAAIFFCHLIALAMYGVLLAGILAYPLRAPWRALLRRGAMAALGIVVPAALVLMSEHPPSAFKVADLAGFGFLDSPVITLTAWDRLFVLYPLLLAPIAILGRVRMVPRVSIAVAAFALFAFLMPAAAGAATLIDSRLKVYLWFVLFAAVTLEEAEMRERLRPVIAFAAVAATALRVWAVEPAWDEFNARAVQVRQMLQSLPMGSRALVVVDHSCGRQNTTMLVNLTNLAVIDRRSFVNGLFAQSGMQPVAPADPMLDGGPTSAMDVTWLNVGDVKGLQSPDLQTPWRQAYADWRRHFSHVIDIHDACATPLKEPGLTPISATPGFDLYRID